MHARIEKQSQSSARPFSGADQDRSSKQHHKANSGAWEQQNDTSTSRANSALLSNGPVHNFGQIPIYAKPAVTLQSKLTINKPGDIYEQEADAVAEKVMRMPASMMQRACACGGTCSNCQKEHKKEAPLQMKRVNANGSEQTEVPSIVHEVLQSSGQPLDTETRSFMEPRFGHDFSKIRIHTDTKASESAKAVNALAYTVGRNIVFSAGQNALQSNTGKQLIAHELAHVLQQGGSANSGVFEGSHVQRQELCPGGVYDEVNKVCRLPNESDVVPAVPDFLSIDGEFWFLPQGVRPGSVPIFDEEDTQVVVGFRFSSSGYYEVYDLEGRMVDIGEPGLQSPLIDPIDILAGGLVGLGRGLLGGGLRAAGRGIVGGAGRGGGAALGSAGLRSLISSLSRRALTAIRATFRAIRFRGPLNFTATTAAHMAETGRRVPHHLLKLAIRYGTRSPDPQGIAGAFRYVIPMFRNGRQYTLEVVLREADQTVLHFLYR